MPGIPDYQGGIRLYCPDHGGIDKEPARSPGFFQRSGPAVQVIGARDLQVRGVYGVPANQIFLHILQPMSEEVCPARPVAVLRAGDSHHVQVLLPVVEKVTVDPEILRLLVPDLLDWNHVKTVDLCIGVREENR